MAAQEKAKQTAPQPAAAAPAPATVDLLDAFDAPAESEAAPPPPSDVSLLPQQNQQPKAPPPPAFDTSILPPAASATEGSKHSSQSTVTPLAASAPALEDLLDPMADQQKRPPPSNYEVTRVAPPTSDNNNTGSQNAEGMDQEAIDAILGIEGLSDEEKAALIAEQEKIMASIEQEKRNKGPSSAAADRADAFEQRSHAAAVQSIGCGGGTTGATRTTTSQTVSALSTADDVAAASQMAADMELAEQLQKEEYKKADQQQRTRAASTATASSSRSPTAASQESSWMEWLGFSSPTTTTTRGPSLAAPDRSFAQRPLERGEIGVSLPPGASRNNAALAAAPTYTGHENDAETETIQFSPSRSEGGEDMALMSGGGGGARIAKPQPLFSCVADSISSAANSLYNSVSTDGEGNLHGVDTSGLLGMSQAVGDSAGGYQKLDNNQRRPT